MVDTKATRVFSLHIGHPHSDHLVYHVHLIFGDLSTLELVYDDIGHSLILGVVDVKLASLRTSAELRCFLSKLMLINGFMRFHNSVHILREYAVSFPVSLDSTGGSDDTSLHSDRHLRSTRVSACRILGGIVTAAVRSQMFKNFRIHIYD